ncbi:MAG: UDP-N-acetylmuramoyl-L-alanyl-D-glutamate--2,6-diaminopimelate ligase [Lysobacterales bacterium]
MTSTSTLSKLLGNVAPINPGDDVVIEGLALDSRYVRPGDAFIALRGSAGHGIEHAANAAAKGARCVLWEPPASMPRLSVPTIRVEHLRQHLGAIADRFYAQPSRALTVTGVTGTNGKTSFVHLLAQALQGAGTCIATIGTLGTGFPGELRAGERTTPDVVTVHAQLASFLEAGAQHVAMEVSSHALDQGRVDGVRFAYAVFTNLTRDHLDYHGDMHSYGAAKAQLFATRGLRCAIINADDAFGRELIAGLPVAQRRLTYGIDGAHAADVQARSVELDAGGVRFQLVTPWGTAPVVSSLIGAFNVSNLLALAATLGVMGWPLADIVESLARLQPVPGRMGKLGGDGVLPLVVIDYAHTPDALEQALSSVRAHTTGKLHVVFGCGGERDVGKRALMGAVAANGADHITITDDNPRGEDGDAIIAAILTGLSAPRLARVERDRACAIADAVRGAGANDGVLIAGKGHEAYQETAGVRRPFDDTSVARAALETRA